MHSVTVRSRSLLPVPSLPRDSSPLPLENDSRSLPLDSARALDPALDSARPTGEAALLTLPRSSRALERESLSTGDAGRLTRPRERESLPRSWLGSSSRWREWERCVLPSRAFDRPRSAPPSSEKSAGAASDGRRLLDRPRVGGLKGVAEKVDGKAAELRGVSEVALMK